MRARDRVRQDRRLPVAVVGGAALVALAIASITSPSAQAADAGTPVPLATAQDFAILAGTGISNDGAGTTIEGDIGSYETPAVTGLLPTQVDGTIRRSDLVPGDEEIMVDAKEDLVAAYNDAAGSLELTEPDLDETELGGKTLTAGVYENPTLGLTGTLTLDGGNDDGTPSDSVFVFKTGTAGSTLITGSNSAVELTGGAQACNVFWQVQSSATFGAGTDFVGTVMALTSISAESGATFEGRLLARNGAVSLINNTINAPGCEQASADDDTTDTDTDVTDTDTDVTDTDTDVTDTDTDVTDTDTDVTDTDVTDTDTDTAADSSDTDSGAGAGGGAAAGSADSNGFLPGTGAPSTWILACGVVALASGGAVLARQRRYRPSHLR